MQYCTAPPTTSQGLEMRALKLKLQSYFNVFIKKISKIISLQYSLEELHAIGQMAPDSHLAMDSGINIE